MSYPYLDLAGFRQRTVMSVAEVDYVEADSPGFTASRIALRTSYINGRLRKRYGTGGTTHNPAASLPLGQVAPVVVGPMLGVTLQGRPTLGSIQLVLTATTGGAVGTAVFSVSKDGGLTTFTTLTTALVGNLLVGTGLTVLWPVGFVATVGDVYAAATPVPEIVLGWLTTMVTYDVLRKRGLNPQDPIAQQLREDIQQVVAELKEAADSKDGLFDLPVSEDLDSAVTTGGPLGHSDASPYGWQQRQAIRGDRQDAEQTGDDIAPWPWDIG